MKEENIHSKLLSEPYFMFNRVDVLIARSPPDKIFTETLINWVGICDLLKIKNS